MIGAYFYIFGIIFLQSFSSVHFKEHPPQITVNWPLKYFPSSWSHPKKSYRSIFYFPTTLNPTFGLFTFKHSPTFIFLVCLFPNSFKSCFFREQKVLTLQLILLLSLSILFSFGNFS